MRAEQSIAVDYQKTENVEFSSFEGDDGALGGQELGLGAVQGQANAFHWFC